MHRAFRLSRDDGTKMIQYYGYDGAYKKLIEGDKEKERPCNKV